MDLGPRVRDYATSIGGAIVGALAAVGFWYVVSFQPETDLPIWM